MAELKGPRALQGRWGRRVGRLTHEDAAVQVDAVEEHVMNGIFTSGQYPDERCGLMCFLGDDSPGLHYA
jgi:hypothetical protein